MAQPQLTVSGLGDLQQTTLPELNRGRIVELTTDLQKFHVMAPDGILNKDGVVTEGGTGKTFEWRLMMSTGGTSANVGLGYQDATSIRDTTITASAEWRNSKSDYSIIGQEEAHNDSPAKIVSLKLLREKAMMIDLVSLMESNWFGNPVALTDTLSPMSMSTMIVKNATEGFNGGVPSGYTTLFNVSPTQYPRFKNYTFQYTTVDDPDFIRKLSKAVEFTEWKPPVNGLPLLNNAARYRYFSNWSLIGPLQELLKASNDNVGMDLLKYQNAVILNRLPLVRVPALEADTTAPIYGIDLGALKIYRLKGWWMRRTVVDKVPGHHTVKAEYLDSSYNFVMVTRRSSFVGATAATYPG